MLKLAGELLEGQLADHIARLDAHTKNPREVGRTGEYIQPFVLAGSYLTQTAMVANTLYAVPFLAARDMTVDRIAVNVITVASGKSARMGVYKDGTNLYPGSLLLDAGEVSVDTGGVKAITINQALPKGLYWLTIVSNGTPTIRTIYYPHTILGINSAHTSFQVGWSVSHSYAALPDPLTAGGGITVDHPFCIALRLASLN